MRTGPLQLAVYAREARRASRRLSATPGFAGAAILVVAFAVTPSVVFQLVWRAVLPPLPYDRPQDLVALYRHNDYGDGATSFPRVTLIRTRSRTLDVAAFTGLQLFLTDKGQRTAIHALAVTSSFFRVLGGRVRLGRSFAESEAEAPLGRPIVVISEAFWRRQFGARPDIVGQQILLNDVAFTVVGVTDARFRGWFGVVRRWVGFEYEDAWIPATMAPVGMISEAARNSTRVYEDAYVWCWGGIGRLRPGATLRQVRAEMELLGTEIQRTWPETADYGDVSYTAVPLAEDAVDPKIVRTVTVLRFAGLLVALLGAIDVGGLFLVRGLARARAIGLERSLGASRTVLLVGAGWEATLVGAAGALVALVLTAGAVTVLSRIEPSIVRTAFGVALDPTAWQIGAGSAAWAFSLGVLSALGGSLAATLHTMRVGSLDLLRVGSGIRGGGLTALRLTRPRGLLIVAELTFAVALTLPALLVARSLGHLVTAEHGFRTTDVWQTRIVLPAARYPVRSAGRFVEEVLALLRQQHGVNSAAWTSTLPFEGTYTSMVKASGSTSRTIASVHAVTPGAFGTLGISVRGGRDFETRDSLGGAPVVALSEAAARELGADVGARVDVAARELHGAEVIAVVGDVRYDDPVKVPMPAVYVPFSQAPETEGVIVVRSVRADVADLVRRLVASLDDSLERVTPTPLRDVVARALARFRVAALLLAVAAAVALGLSTVGIYGVMSSLVARSSAEIGIRIALGAAPTTIAGQVMRAIITLGSTGLTLGLLLGLTSIGPLKGYLFRVGSFDVAALTASALIGAGAGVGAGWLPARRAMRVDPASALRSE